MTLVHNCTIFLCSLDVGKNWAKSANSVHSRVITNPQTAIQGCHCQLDDQCRGPSIKGKDHLAG